jgi:hypothetical protein
MDCFAALAMTTRHNSAISPRVFARGFVKNVPPIEKRAWGMPGAQCTRSLAGRKTSHTSGSHHEFTGKTPSIPARNGFNSCFVLSPAIGLFCHRRLAEFGTSARLGLSTSASLDTSVEMSGPHDFTVRFGAVRQPAADRSRETRPAITCHARRCRVHRIPFRVLDVAQRPSCGTG